MTLVPLENVDVAQGSIVCSRKAMPHSPCRLKGGVGFAHWLGPQQSSHARMPREDTSKFRSARLVLA